MKITERLIGDVVVLDLEGKMTLGEGDEDFEERVKQLVRAGQRKIVINGADQSYIDSSGLGAISRSYTCVARSGGSLKLLKPTQRVMDLLAITKLLTVFEIYEHEAQAIDSFSTAT